MKEYNWAKEIFEGKSSNLDVAKNSNVSTIEILNAKEGKIEDLKIYGNSIQNGEPTPENPVEIESVGDLVTEENDTYYGKYRISLSVEGKNLAKINPDCKVVNWAGITVVGNDDGTYTINGTATGEVAVPLVGDFDFNQSIVSINKGKYYNVSKKVFSGEGGLNTIIASAKYGDTKEYNFLKSGEITDSPTEDGVITMIAVWIPEGASFTNYTIGVQIENVENENSEATEFEAYNSDIYNIYLDEPLRKVGEYTDYLDLNEKRVVRNVRNLNLAIKDMNNYDDWPGWTGIDEIKLDFGINRNETLGGIRKFKSNITNNIDSIGINTLNVYSPIIWLEKSVLALSQSEWKNQYPDMIMNLQYGKDSSMENIDLPNIQLNKGTNIITVDTTTTPSNIEAIYNKEK